MNLKTLKIGVVGGGTVGHATGKAWEGHVAEVLVHDVRPERANALLSEVLRCDLVFVCLPTPQREGSLECDVDALVSFFERLSQQQREANLVIKSTVPVGFTRRTAELIGCPNLVHSPEFLTARTAVEDAVNPNRLVVGGDISDGRTLLCWTYDARWPDCNNKYLMTSDESEAVKLAQNAFSAVKVAWFNELHRMCKASGMDFETVRTALLAGGWINSMHTQVPGPDGKCGFGGSCLPKDLANWIRCCDEADVSPEVSAAAFRHNPRDRSRA